MGGVQLVQSSEHLVQSMEKGAVHMAVPVNRALIQPKGIINKDVHKRQKLGVGA